MKQQVRKGIQGRELVETYEMLDDLTPERRGRCKSGQKSVGQTCCNPLKPITITFNENVSDALSRASHYIKTLPRRIQEVQRAADDAMEELK